jgi:hypothetical protein
MEGTGVRALAPANTSDGSNLSVQFYASFCSGYKMLSVENASKSNCSDSLRAGSTLIKDSDCSIVCLWLSSLERTIGFNVYTASPLRSCH